jgi:myo-inositol-1(or 4)-monophosphatase
MNNPLKLCSAISAAIDDAIAPVIGTAESGRELYIGADGTPTKKIDEVAENAALEVLRDDGRRILLISVPFYSVSIAIGGYDLADLSFGYVRNLYSGEVYHADAGKGAYRNKKRISVSGNDELKKFSVTAYAYRTDSTKISDLGRTVRRIRVLGSASLELCYVAAGVLDAFVDFRRYLRVIDIAAGKLIVEESGGSVTNTTGARLRGELSIGSRVSMIASNGQIHGQLLELIAE